MPGQHQPPGLNLSARHWHVALVSMWPGLEFRSRKQTGEGSHASSTVRTPDMHGDTALTPGALSLQATLSRLPVVPHFHSSGLGRATRGPGGVCAGGLAWICSLLRFPRVLLQVVFHDVGVLTDKLFPVVEAMQKHFSAGSGTYYSDSIFFLSVAMHQIMPKGNLGAGPKPWFRTSVSFPLAPKRLVP